MERRPRPRVLPKTVPSIGRPSARMYEGGDTIPIPADKSDLLTKFREKVSPPLAPLSLPERFTKKELGAIPTDLHPELPVRQFKERILTSIATNQVTIITAETGAGKSTQVPQYLLEAGYHISMTQPRRISASFVAERIQDEVVAVLGDDIEHAHDLVGFHTAERNTTVKGRTKIEVVTDGLRLVQEFGERDELENEVLVIDEVHEWNANIEMLIARAKQLLAEKPELRIVIMSATMEAQKLADYFSEVTDIPPSIIEVPGRNHEVTKLEKADSTVAAETLKYVKMGENVLVFLPGVKEIEDTSARLETLLAEEGITGVTILPLHSKLTTQQQDAVRHEYPGPKIILATNIAQTSITIPDVNVVIDSGLERRNEIDDEGTESLNLRLASRADLAQRAGRTGRVAPGTYILTRYDEQTTFASTGDVNRLDYPVPEILRIGVDRVTLIAAAAGVDFSELQLFHPVSANVIDRAKTALFNLGAMDQEGKITPRGQRMASLPMRPKYARMIIESQDQGYPMQTRAQVAAMVAALEVGGLPSWLRDASREWRKTLETTDSDHIAQLELFINAQPMTALEAQRIGLDTRNIERAKELYEKISRRTGLPVYDPVPSVAEADYEPLRRVIASGMIDFLYEKRGVKEYARVTGTSGQMRTLGDRSTVIGAPPLVVAVPYGIERKRSGVTQTEHIIQDVTTVTSQLMAEVAIHLVEWQNAGYTWRDGRLKQVQSQMWRSVETLQQRLVDPEPSEEIVAVVRQKLLEKSGPALQELKTLKAELEALQHLTQETLPLITQEKLEEIIEAAIDGHILDASHVDMRIRNYMQEHDLTLKSLLGRSTLERIRRNAPTSVVHEGHEHPITYRSGHALIKLSSPEVISGWKKPLILKDGREVLFVIGRKRFTFAEVHASL